jgi:scopoletin glucosyltransferase
MQIRHFPVVVLTTPANVIYIEPTIDQTNKFLNGKIETYRVPISISSILFPFAELGLSEGVEHVSVSSSPEVRQNIFQAALLLEKPLEHKL